MDNDYPIHQPRSVRTAHAEREGKRIAFKHKYLLQYRFTQCIHGHFLPYKYRHFYGKEGSLFVTWLRDPAERLGSHYHYWQRAYDPDTSQPLHKKVVEEGWSLEKFCLSEEIRNIYKLYLWQFSLQDFDFVGILEHYEEDLTCFARKYLDKNISEVPEFNVNKNRNRSYFSDDSFVDEIKEFHSQDYHIYRRALERRRERMSQGGQI